MLPPIEEFFNGLTEEDISTGASFHAIELKEGLTSENLSAALQIFYDIMADNVALFTKKLLTAYHEWLRENI